MNQHNNIAQEVYYINQTKQECIIKGKTDFQYLI